MDERFAPSHRYFENRDCKFYPCHKGTEHINCLFCYCPLYLAADCPGDYEMTKKDGRMIKSCLNCTFPHEYDNYGKVIKAIKSADFN